jgi:hypothetical protein
VVFLFFAFCTAVKILKIASSYFTLSGAVLMTTHRMVATRVFTRLWESKRPYMTGLDAHIFFCVLQIA